MRLDIKSRRDKILLFVLGCFYIISISLMFFSSILPKELVRVRGAGLLGLISNFFGTILLGLTLIKSDSEVKDISGTYFGGNADLEKDMFANRRMALWGLILIVIGFLFQIIDVIISYYMK